MPFCNLCASKDGTFERENYYVTPPDGLTAETLRVFGLHGFTSWGIYQLTLVSLTQKTPVAKGRGYRLMAIKPTDDSADQKQKRNKKENQDR